MSSLPQTAELVGVEKVSRLRRFVFISSVVAFCLGGAATFGALTALNIITGTPVVVTLVESFISLATAISLAYVTGSVIDHGVNTFNNRKAGEKQ